MLFLAPHTPPTWFANLDQEDQNKMVELLSQALNQYGSFGREVKQDLIEKFQIKDFQAEELYKFVYHSRNLFFFKYVPSFVLYVLNVFENIRRLGK
jgi:hypothetical protein